MKKTLFLLAGLLCLTVTTMAQQRRPIDNTHPLWMIHIDVWNTADPQKIIDLVPEDIRPYVCMNLSLSCQYDKDLRLYKMPQNAVRTYKSWASVCQQNGLWFTCQPASGGRIHLQTSDLETFEYFFKRYPNFLGWNYAEQFWGFDEDDLGSARQVDQIALFAKLVEMSHRYGGFLTISFCGNIWSHALNPIGMLKRNSDLLDACKKYPESILWLYKYTTSSCFYNNESVTFGPFISGLTKNYGVRYDNCGWNGALSELLGENNGRKYPVAAGIGTVMEQTGMNGGAVWDGPELIWTEDFEEIARTTVDGYTHRNWATFDGFRGAWIDMFRKVIDGTLYIPTRQEVVGKTKIVVINDKTSGNDEEKYATWGDLYDGLYKQTDPFNRGNGQWMNNSCYFKKTGRYGTIPVVTALYDDAANAIPVKVKRSGYTTRWSTQTRKVNDFNARYPELAKGDLYVNRFKNQLVTYTPYSYMNKKRTATGEIPLQYNTCDSLKLTLGMLGSALVREYGDHIDLYLNNFRSDTTTMVTETIVVTGAKAEPSYTLTKRQLAAATAVPEWNAETGAYTLTVRHKGGVDLTIHCAGEATGRSTDPAGSTALTADLPVQPAPYHGEIIIEAEDMDYKNVKSCVTNPFYSYPSVRGHSANGFMDMGTSTSGALRHQLTLGEAGDYRITVRYTSSAKGGKMRAVANGKSVLINMEKTEENAWRKVTFDAALRAGKNNLVLNNMGGVPAYIDQIIYTPADVEAERYLITVREADHGAVRVISPAPNGEALAAEGDTVTLSITADEGYTLSELRMVNGVHFTMGTTIQFSPTPGGENAQATLSFTMPDDLVTLQPVFGRANEVEPTYRLDFSKSSAGTLPPGWRCVQDGGTVHEYPDTYTQGARIFAGFTGYQGRGLYWRNDRAEYGRQSAYPLRLDAGEYVLSFATAAWKESPRYKAKILDMGDAIIAESEVYTATPNAEGSTSANLTSAQSAELPFTISEAGNYVLRFEDATGGGGLHEFLLLDCEVTCISTPDAIRIVSADGTESTTIRGSGIYGLGGERRRNLQPGFNIIRTPDGGTKKVMVR